MNQTGPEGVTPAKNSRTVLFLLGLRPNQARLRSSEGCGAPTIGWCPGSGISPAPSGVG